MATFVDEPRDPKNALIVDGLNLAFRWKHSGKYIGMQEDYIRDGKLNLKTIVFQTV